MSDEREPFEDWQNFRGWWDHLGFFPWPLVSVAAAMVAVVVGEILWLACAASPDTAALLTGIAAVVSAAAAVIEARRGSEVRDAVADHEARLRVLEDRANRSN